MSTQDLARPDRTAGESRSLTSGAGLPAGTARRRWLRRRLAGHWLAISPALLLVTLIIGIPGVATLALSFTTWSGTGPIHWTGLASWSAAFRSGNLLGSLGVTLIFALLSAAATTVLGLMLALLVHWKTPGWRAFRLIWFLPAIAPQTAVGVYWSTALQPNLGFINGLLGAVGLGGTHAWLASPALAKYVLAGIWTWTAGAFAFLLVLGALRQIPVEVEEAAMIDGAGFWRRLRSCVLPLVRPVLGTVAALQFIWAFNGFTLVYSTTQGGPGNSTQILPVDVYLQAFTNQAFGVGAAIAMVGTVVLFAVGAVLLGLTRSLIRD
jgi:ABC-type sugar transport system permease subunit